jgi:hypothetical protein
MLDRLAQFLNQDQGRQQEYRDFERRYQEHPEEISDAEAARRYREMMAQIDNDDDEDVRQSYDQAFSRMSPQERRALAQRFQEATRDPGRPYQGYRDDYDLDRASQPHELGRMMRQASHQDPDLLEQLVGPNSPLSGTAGKVAMAGAAAFLARRFFGNR